MEDAELYQIALDYLESLPQKDVAQDSFKVDKLAVVFAGIPGSGKTYLSKILEDRRQALRFSSSEIREMIKEEDPDVSIQALNDGKDRVIEHLVKLTEDEANNLIVLDKSVDRNFDEIRRLFESNGYHLLVISVETDLEEAKERIKERESNYEDYEPHFQAWFDQHEEFLDEYTTDLTLNGMSPDEEALLQRVDRHLHNEKGTEPDPMDDISASDT